VVRSLHRDLGTRLAADGAPAWRVAHHLSLGAAEGDMLAVDWLHRAGLEAAPRDPFAAVALLERAVDLVPPNAPEATSVGDQIAQATCHLGLTVADANAGRLETASAHGAAAVRLAESVQTPQLLMVNAHVSYAWTLEEQDLLGDALATVDRLSTAVGEREEAPTTAQIERWRARAHYVAGRWDDPMVDLDSALLVNASGIDVWPEPFALRALIRIHRGEVDVAQEDLDRFEALVAAGAPVLVLDQPMLATKPTSRGSCGGTPACLRRVDRALPRRADRRHIRTRSTRRC
jgi:hypothetical protein